MGARETNRYGLTLALLAAATLVLSASRRVPLGHVSDEAQALLTARAFHHSSSLPPLLPDVFPYSLYVLFPKMLSPLMPHLLGVKVLTLFFGSASVVLFGVWVAPWMSRRRTRLVVALFALNPWTLVAVSRVTMDGFFLTLTLAAFLLLRREIRFPSVGTRWPLVFASAGAAACRPEGLFLGGALALGSLAARRGRLAAFVFIGTLIPIGFSATFLAKTSPALLPFLFGGLPRDSDWTQGISQTVEGLVWSLAIGSPLSTSWAAPASLLICAFAGLLIMSRGQANVPSGRPAIAGLVASLSFAFFYTAYQTFWTLSDLSLWPMLPMMLLISALLWPSDSQTARRAGGIVVGCLGLFYLRQDIQGIRHSWDQKSLSVFTPAEWAALSQSLPEHARVWCPNAPEFTWHTGRSALSKIEAADPDAFRFALLESSVTHVCFETAYPAFAHREWVEGQAPYVERLVSEHGVLYEVRADPAFQHAYRLYRDASDELHLGHWDHGFALLEQSLDERPSVAAMNAYAASALLSNSRFDRARYWLNRALLDHPTYALAVVNLARIEERQGFLAKAYPLFQRAKTLVDAQGPLASLLLTINLGLEHTRPKGHS